MSSGISVAKKMRESKDSTLSREELEALHTHVRQKLLEANPSATNGHFLEALMHETHTPTELKKFYDDLEADHAAHRERMARHAESGQAGADNQGVDLRKLGKGLMLIAEAMAGEHSPSNPARGKG